MDVVETPIDKLVPYARNPRRNEEAVATVAASLAEFGWRQPIVVDEDMVIVVGHTRYEAAIDVQRNGASIGTIRSPASASTAVFIAASETVLEPGDLLEVIAPASPDATLADIAITLAGTLMI